MTTSRSVSLYGTSLAQRRSRWLRWGQTNANEKEPRRDLPSVGREKKNVTEIPESHGQIATNRRDLAWPLALRGRLLAGTTLVCKRAMNHSPFTNRVGQAGLRLPTPPPLTTRVQILYSENRRSLFSSINRPPCMP